MGLDSGMLDAGPVVRSRLVTKLTVDPEFKEGTARRVAIRSTLAADQMPLPTVAVANMRETW